MADNVFAVLGKGKVKDRGQGPLSKKEQRKVAAARQAALNFVEAAASSSAAAPEAADPGEHVSACAWHLLFWKLLMSC